MKALKHLKKRLGDLIVSSRYKIYNRSLKGKYRDAKRSAKTRGFAFSLSFDEFTTVLRSTKMACIYCGYKLSDCGSSLDRVDSSQGYIASNVVPCCTVCNRAKGTLSYKEFRGWAKRIANRVKGISLKNLRRSLSKDLENLQDQ